MSKIVIEFEMDEIKAMSGMIDAAVRSLGLRAVKDAAKIMQKIETAMEGVQNNA